MDVAENNTAGAPAALETPALQRPKRKKVGGRAKGTPNKATVERLRAAERAVAVGHGPGPNKRLAIDYMDEMIVWMRKLVDTLVPFEADGTLKEGHDPKLWFQVVNCLQSFLNMRAPYQSPRLSAVQLVPAGQAQQRTTVNVTILNERGDEVFSDAAEDPKLIEHDASMEEDVSSNEDEAV